MSAPGTAAPALSPGRERALLLALAGVQFTNILDFMIMMPLGPQLTRAFGIDAAQFGLLVSSYNLAAGASGLLAATYIDRFARKPLLLSLYALFALATVACALAPGYGSLIAARVAAGIFGGVLGSMVQTIVGEVIPLERRGRAMGVVMTAFSVSTVAGVPVGLWLSQHFDWHAPFMAIAVLSIGVMGTAAALMPRLDTHLQRPMQAGWSHVLDPIKAVLGEPNHWRAFAVAACTLFGSFLVIPYVTLHMQGNVGLTDRDIPPIYLAGGLATLVTARLIGRLTDRWGRVNTYRLMMSAGALAMLALTSLPKVPFALALVVSTVFFICVSGRMIPGMAIVTSAASPAYRGTFQTINSSIQAAAMGLAAFVGGLIIVREPSGALLHYWVCALLAAMVSALAMWLAPQVKVPTTPT